jgi:glycosyltransferase involved in cell wall biosynthesis
MTVRNVSSTIIDCLLSILNQSFTNFEVIIIDDFSKDNTNKLVQKLKDKRIRYFVNKKWLGISPSRNKGIEKAIGDFIFFTDGDCNASKNWINSGLKYLRDRNYVGVEGRIIYISEEYKPTFSDRVMENKHGGQFMTGNIAYKKKILEKVGGFDERLTYLEDRDIAYKMKHYGKIGFNPKMIVYHPKVIVTPRKLIESSVNIKNRVHLYKKWKVKDFLLWRILYPLNLIKLLFPPLIFSSLFFKKFTDKADFRLLPFTYLFLINQRIYLWKECAREKVFLI